MSGQVPLHKFTGERGYVSSADPLSDELQGAVTTGSKNSLFLGRGKWQNFKGLPAVAGFGGRVFANTVASGYAALADYNPGSGAVTAGGNVFISIGNSLWFIGAGQLYIDAVLRSGAIADSLLQLLVYRNSYTAALTGPYQVGLAAPSAPVLAAKDAGSGFEGKLSGKYASCLTRVRSLTGCESTRSSFSSVITADGQSARETYPLPDSNGQDRWGRYRTKAGFADEGPFYFQDEIAERRVSTEAHADGAIASGSTTLSSATAAFTSDVSGKLAKVVGAGVDGEDLYALCTYLSASTVALSMKASTTVAAASFSLMSVVGVAPVTVSDATATAGSKTLTTATDAFSASDAGSYVEVIGAGVDGATLIALIETYTDAQNVEMSVKASTTTSAGATTATFYAGVERSLETEWNDAELFNIFAPIDNAPPPAGTFGCALEDVVLVGNAYETCIAVSIPLNQENFPADNLLYMPGRATGLAPRPAKGYCFVWGADFLGVLTYTGSAVLPVALLILWSDTGFAYQWNVCIVEDELFGWTKGHGAVRLRMGENSDAPDTTFAVDVVTDFEAWAALGVFVGYDVTHQLVVYGHGTTLLAYSRQNGRWSTPVDISSFIPATHTICGMFTHGNELHIATRASGSLVSNLYRFNAGTTGSAGRLVFPWASSPDGETQIIMGFDLACRVDHEDTTVTADIYASMQRLDGVGVGTLAETINYAPDGAGTHAFMREHPNVRNARYYQLVVDIVSASGGDAGFSKAQTHGILSGVW